MRNLVDRNCTHTIVTGTPGIGKTMFGHYAVKQFLENNYAVIYIYMGWNNTHLFLPKEPHKFVLELLTRYGVAVPSNLPKWIGRFDGEVCLSYDADALYQELVSLEKGIVVVVDPPKLFGKGVFAPPRCGALVVASPGTTKSNLSVLADAHGLTLFMPLWTMDELVTLMRARLKASETLTQADLDQLEIRVGRFGPIPRYVAKANTSHEEMLETAQDVLTTALNKINPAGIREALNPDSTSPEVSGVLVHLSSNADFRFSQKKFASDMIEKEIMYRCFAERREDLVQMLAACNSIASFSQTVGNLSERVWCSVLRRGGSYSLQELLPPASKKRGAKPRRGVKRAITLPLMGTRYSARQKLSDVGANDLVPSADEAGVFLSFLKGNVPNVDALCCVPASKGHEIFGTTSSPTDGMTVLALQMTINKEHKLNGHGLLLVLDTAARACGPGTPSVHYVVVTNEEHGDDFHWTKPSVEDDQLFKVRQWVLVVEKEALSAVTERADAGVSS